MRATAKGQRAREGDLLRARAKAWRAANAAKVKTYNGAYHAANRERDAKQKHDRRLADLEAARARDAAAGRKSNWVHQRNRRARERGAPGTHTPQDIADIRARQNDRCAMPFCCTELSGKGHVDHIVAISKGGSNWPSNLQLLCQPCNQKKFNRDLAEFLSASGGGVYGGSTETARPKNGRG